MPWRCRQNATSGNVGASHLECTKHGGCEWKSELGTEHTRVEEGSGRDQGVMTCCDVSSLAMSIADANSSALEQLMTSII